MAMDTQRRKNHSILATTTTTTTTTTSTTFGAIDFSGKLLLLIATFTAMALPITCEEEIREFCQFNSFKAECPAGEVIMMTHARYGRMRLGRCVVADLGYVGCYTDVLHLADRRCSGRRKCEISIPDESFDRISTCLTELTKYLEASYKCVKVTSTSRSVCSVCNYGVKLSAPSGRIASVVAEETGCGTPDCPWIIEAQPGQRVNLSLVDFALSRQDGTEIASSFGSSSCRVYATIKEESVTRSFTVCGGEGRNRHVYTSLTNTVEVRIVGQPTTSDGRDHFLLNYEAVGCADPHQPAHGWSKRSGTRAVLGCNDTGDRWELLCKEGRWVGKASNCSSGSAGIFAHSVLGSGNMPSGLSIVVILAVAVTIGLVIFIVGLVVLKGRHGRARQPPTAQQVHGRGGVEAQYMKSGYESSDPAHDHLHDKGMLPGHDKNEYAHIWEMPLPQPRPGDATRTGTIDRTAASGGHGRGGGNGPYGYRSNTLPAYPVVPLGHDQNYDNHTLARMDRTEFIEREEDPRYFELDPERATDLSEH